jgi:HlyD family secretion protein
MQRLKILLALAVVLCAGLAVYLLMGRNDTGPLVLHGNVDVREGVCAFRVGGRISQVLVDEGERVKPGQALARLDDDILRNELAKAEAALAGEKAQLARLKKGYRTEEIAQAESAMAAAAAVAENARINLERVQTMRGANAISQKELDNARASAKESTAQFVSAKENFEMLTAGYRAEDVQAQEAQVAAATASLELARIHLADATLPAPENGVVLSRVREAGTIVQAGDAVYTLALTDPTWIRAYVDEPNLPRIAPGMAVNVHLDAFPGKTFPGVVGYISPSAEFTPKTVETQEVRTNLMYRIRIQVEDSGNVMRQGMPVVVDVAEAGKDAEPGNAGKAKAPVSR